MQNLRSDLRENSGRPRELENKPITTGASKLGESLGPTAEVDETSLHVRAKTEGWDAGETETLQRPLPLRRIVANSQHARVRR